MKKDMFLLLVFMFAVSQTFGKEFSSGIIKYEFKQSSSSEIIQSVLSFENSESLL